MVTQPVTMYDSLDVTAIPAGATFVAGYIDGEDRTWQALVRRFPKAHKESITRSPQFRADWLDVESGAAQPSDVPAWTAWMRSLGLIPGVYTTADNWSVIVTLCGARRIAPPLWWAADWTGEPHLVTGSVATQWTSPISPVNPSPGDYDVSLIGPNFPHRVKGKSVNLNLDTTRIASAIAAEVVAIGNQAHLPASVRAALGVVGGVILTVEHYIAKPTS